MGRLRSRLDELTGAETAGGIPWDQAGCLPKVGEAEAGDLVVGQKEKPWGPQVLVFFSFEQQGFEGGLAPEERLTGKLLTFFC